ncbi:unnamed protein product [Phaedon cochleariae]|uniref:tRNA-dihydrouridine(47) synthase [NAD(P)(+)] n=1 Tax=Phaedon cochleariae TaxID=80249 RepID=A0A9P0DS07_PHACE|nr:unnamed protein product [Phaedon cochleariae]
MSTTSGVCILKPEFVQLDVHRELNLDHVSDKDKRKLESEGIADNLEPHVKKQKLSKKEKKALRGQNKSRGPTFRRDFSKELCICLINIEPDEEIPKCTRNKCSFLHDVDEYLKSKPKDLGENCYNFDISGKCSRGLACRFGGSHISPDGKNIVDQEKFKQYAVNAPYTTNQLQFEVQTALRKRTYNFDLSESLIKYNDCIRKKEEVSKDVKLVGSVTDEDIIKLKAKEKKKIDFTNKLFLSPLTTVGNLPFRRICKEYGADITCGEMAMCTTLLQGASHEWALVKRHKSEDIFGVQLCANNPHFLTKCGEMLQKEADIDFIDLNVGCPIELVYTNGGGCGMMRRTRVFESCIKNLTDILSIPLTVKMRMGVYSNDNIAHKLAPMVRDCGASLLTIHGRSREQRYTKSSNWDYIRTVAVAASPLPVIGNGDILSFEDYQKAREVAPEISGVMIGRGALIKPWIFTEIKEGKLLDISSSERFDILKKYTNYGLEHWGSDNIGIENTRRFLLEWLSFLYRYIPVGILEKPPQKINERPPSYKGRDELETLMASPAASDWIKISEMLLGPVPENFHFLPKHKANSYN